jgi:hypothetical protein
LINYANFFLSATVIAAPSDSRPFKFKLVTPRSTVFLAASGSGASSQAEGVDCTINAGAISCGANKGGLGTAMHSKMAPSPRAVNNKGWSVSPADNRIIYAPYGKPFNLAVRGRDLWVENCDAHPDRTAFTKGTAYAVYN